MWCPSGWRLAETDRQPAGGRGGIPSTTGSSGTASGSSAGNGAPDILKLEWVLIKIFYAFFFFKYIFWTIYNLLQRFRFEYFIVMLHSKSYSIPVRWSACVYWGASAAHGPPRCSRPCPSERNALWRLQKWGLLLLFFKIFFLKIRESLTEISLWKKSRILFDRVFYFEL